MNQTYNLVEFFSGIGSQARALENLNVNINTLGTCEWDIHAFIAYDAIHNSPDLDEDISVMDKPELLDILKDYTLSNNGKEAMEYSMLKTYSVETLRYIYSGIIKSNNYVDISSLNGESMPDSIDILTYSFPCQDLSNVGAFHGYNNDTPSRRKIWDENPQIILPDGSYNRDVKYVRTITTKQDRNPNSGNLYFDSKIEGRSKFRYLTPRECLLFMGFKDKDFRHIKRRNVEMHKGDYLFPRDKIIRMAGNSIPVKLLEGLFWLMIQTDEYMDDYKNGRT